MCVEILFPKFSEQARSHKLIDHGNRGLDKKSVIALLNPETGDLMVYLTFWVKDLNEVNEDSYTPARI